MFTGSVKTIIRCRTISSVALVGFSKVVVGTWDHLLAITQYNWIGKALSCCDSILVGSCLEDVFCFKEDSMQSIQVVR